MRLTTTYFPSVLLASLVAFSEGCGSDTVSVADEGGSAGAVSAGAANFDCDFSSENCDGFSSERPFRLSEHGAAYFEDAGRLVVFGGSTAIPDMCNFPPGNYQAETWIYDEACAMWKKLDIEGPSPRGRHAMVFGGGFAWMTGGRFQDEETTGLYDLYNDLWRFDLEEEVWTEIEVDGESPPPRTSAGMAWDSARGWLWLYGGNTARGNVAEELIPPEHPNDVWSFDPESRRWTEHETENLPPSRHFHRLIYDSTRDRIVAFSGAASSQTNLRDMWALDLDSFVWTEIDAGLQLTPVGRFGSGLVYAKDVDQYVMFAGHSNDSVGNRNDLWSFDPTDVVWTRDEREDELPIGSEPLGLCSFPPDYMIIDDSLPERRSSHTFVWSDRCNRALLFAGKTDCGALDDVWYLQAGQWQNVLEATEGETCLRWRDNPDDCTDLCN